jgi:hypothetical protein
MATSMRVNRNTSNELAVIGVRLLDDAHMTWVVAESEAGHALRAWCKGAPSHRDAAYHAYRAAADREEAAARDQRGVNGGSDDRRRNPPTKEQS